MNTNESKIEIKQEPFIYLEHKKGEDYLIKECSSCTIEHCIDYHVEIGLATDITEKGISHERN